MPSFRRSVEAPNHTGTGLAISGLSNLVLYFGFHGWVMTRLTGTTFLTWGLSPEGGNISATYLFSRSTYSITRTEGHIGTPAFRCVTPPGPPGSESSAKQCMLTAWQVGSFASNPAQISRYPKALCYNELQISKHPASAGKGNIFNA